MPKKWNNKAQSRSFFQKLLKKQKLKKVKI